MRLFCTGLLLLFPAVTSLLAQQQPHLTAPSSSNSVFLRSKNEHNGAYAWKIKKVSDVQATGTEVSSPSYNDAGWQPAIVPGTVLHSLVNNGVYPDPYFGDNNRKTRQLIPDIAEAGREFYHYWFRTAFSVPASFAGKRIWLKFHGINYRCDIWVNGKQVGNMAGMFNDQSFDITDIANRNGQNSLAVNLLPVDVTGSNSKPRQNRPGAIGENRNGGDGEIGKNVSMLMSVGWDFTAPDGIRDRNTGIWRDVELFATGAVTLEHPFVTTTLPLPDTTSSSQSVSVEVVNNTTVAQQGMVTGTIKENQVNFQQAVSLLPGERKTITFSPSEYKQLVFTNPRLWWPINKGSQHLYTVTLQFTSADKSSSHSTSTRFGIRSITSDQHTPDNSRRFYVNGYPVFIRGSNWVPEAMLRNSEQRTYAELRYTKQAGINLLRLWGGGIAESDYFYQLCDEMGILVWTEFWITGDTRFPTDTSLYLQNVASTVKRLRNHASSAYYVSSNESTEIPGARKLIQQLDPTRGYQMQSECCGVHDGSPYKYENPMQYFENTASQRGSRVDGFNPEYGTPCLPTVESLRELMPAKDLWPINDSVWKYLDGGGFHQMVTKYKQAVNEFGTSNSIEEFAKKAQLVGALNFRAIWEVWNYNKFNCGDRFASGFLFWYHNSPLPQTAARMYDWSLEPTAALYYSQNGLAPIHPQFDYLKNTVSVYNDYRTAFTQYTVTANVYDLQSTLVSTISKTIDIPADGLAKDVFKLDFPATLSQVHFISLVVKDANGQKVADAFYWRSSDAYKGAWTMTGPAVSGFSSLASIRPVNVNVISKTRSAQGKNYVEVTVTNPGTTIAFFMQLKLQTAQEKSIKPAYYSDNFFSLLPGESKQVTIEYDSNVVKEKNIQLVLDSWNTSKMTKPLFFNK
jgi:hypothetical protein